MANQSLPVVLAKTERAELEELARRGRPASGVSRRARVVLLMADGVPGVEIARRTGYSTVHVSRIRRRFTIERLHGLADRPRPGRPRAVNPKEITRVVTVTLRRPPARLTRWTTREVGRRTGLSHSMVLRIWQAHGLQPQRPETLGFALDPEAHVISPDIVGLCVSPPRYALAIGLDGVIRKRAMGWSRPKPLLRPGLSAQPMHDRQRSGVKTLLEALGADRRLIVRDGRTQQTSVGLKAFLKKLARDHRGCLHVIIDDASPPGTVAVQAWLAATARIHLHCIPRGGSWFSLLQAWCNGLIHQSIYRGSSSPLPKLLQCIRAYVDDWSEHPLPFLWIKGAQEFIGG